MKLSSKPRKRSPKRVALRPEFNAEQAKAQFQGQRLSFPRNYERLVDRDELGVEDGTVKYLFLRQTLPTSLVENTFHSQKAITLAYLWARMAQVEELRWVGWVGES
jgi:hypothetical protein